MKTANAGEVNEYFVENLIAPSKVARFSLFCSPVRHTIYAGNVYSLYVYIYSDMYTDQLRLPV